MKFIMISLFTFSLFTSSFYKGLETEFVINDVTEHLGQFEEFNQSHHDNIDEDYPKHSHTHKHSENGAEHSHDHNHHKVTINEIEISKAIDSIRFTSFDFYYKDNFEVKFHFSKAFPDELFRPPIV